MAQFQQLQADRLLDLEAAKAVQTTEAATTGQAPQSDLGQVIGGIGSVASSMVKYKSQDKAAEAEKLLKDINEKKLQTMFDDIGLKLDAGLFSADYTKGVEYFIKAFDNKQKSDIASSETDFMAKLFGSKKGITEKFTETKKITLGPETEHELIPGQSFSFNDDGSTNVFTEVESEREKLFSLKERFDNTLKKYGVPKNVDLFKARKNWLELNTIQGATTGEQAKENMQIDTWNKQVAENERIEKSNLPKDATLAAEFRKEVRKVKNDAFAFKDESVGTRVLFDKIKDGMATGATDMAIVFSFMKSLDPRSVVKEAEFAQAVQTAGGAASLTAWLDKMESGKILNKSSMMEFVQLMFMAQNGRAKLNRQKALQLVKGSTELYYPGEENAYKKAEQVVMANFPATNGISIKEQKKLYDAIAKDERFAQDWVSQWAKKKGVKATGDKAAVETPAEKKARLEKEAAERAAKNLAGNNKNDGSDDLSGQGTT